MLSTPTRNRIQQLAADYWQTRRTNSNLAAHLAGAETGKSIGAIVEAETIDLLTGAFRCGFEQRRGVRVARSAGDVWLADRGRWHPLNVKSGAGAAWGRPNVVSLRRMISMLAAGTIDSYWLLIVRMHADGSPIATGGVEVRLENLFALGDHLAFDAGTGQLMLQEETYWPAVRAGEIGATPALETVFAAFKATLERGIDELIERRLRLRDEVQATTLQPFDQTALRIG